MKAELINHNNDDLLCVNAARVSMDKESTIFTFRKDKPKSSDEGLLHYLADHKHWTPFSHVRFTLVADFKFVDLSNINPEDVASAVWRSDGHTFKFRTSLYGWVHLIKKGLIVNQFVNSVVEFLYEKVPNAAKALLPGMAPTRTSTFTVREVESYKETDPAFIDVTMREHVPIFVARQRFKHMVGTTYNEVSRRYVDDTPEIYHIDEWRTRPDGSIKQGSGGLHPDSKAMAEHTRARALAAVENYKDDIEECYAPEQVRALLPQNMITSYYVTASLNAWLRAYKERSDPHAQLEIQRLAVDWNAALLDSPHSDIWSSLTA